MSEFKAVMFLVILAIVMFGIWFAFTQGYLDPLLDKVGVNLTTMVDNVFKTTTVKP